MSFALSDFETIRVAEADDDIALVTLHRPDRLNAITSTMISELSAVVDAIDLDPHVRAVILTGEGHLENRTQIMCSATGDTIEARDAFVEKRPPVGKGL